MATTGAGIENLAVGAILHANALPTQSTTHLSMCLVMLYSPPLIAPNQQTNSLQIVLSQGSVTLSATSFIR